MDKSWNKSRVHNLRAKWWDYSDPGEYFITIRTQGHQQYFGEIDDHKTELSSIGIIADIVWHEIPFHAINIELGPYVIMPDHIHGIIQITNGNAVGKGHALSDWHAISRYQNIGTNSISSIIGSFKSAVTKHTHRLGYTFQWQPRFYDHMIRNPREYHDIAEYIHNNPMNWGLKHPPIEK